MIDTAFTGFVHDNLATLDELTRLYAEYRQETGEAFWKDLCSFMRNKTPRNYTFKGDNPFWKLGNERRCGWERDIGGQRATIAFGVSLDPGYLSRGRWPFSGHHVCWTGIRVDGVGAHPNLRNAVLEVGRKLAPDTELPESSWLVWRGWEALCDADVEEFHRRITEAGRASSQEAILQDLLRWTEVIEDILRRPTQSAQEAPSPPTRSQSALPPGTCPPESSAPSAADTV